jgi:hypothetical protein
MVKVASRICVITLLCVLIPSLSYAFQFLPPVEWADRASAPSSGVVSTELYNDPEWAKSWCGPDD